MFVKTFVLFLRSSAAGAAPLIAASRRSAPPALTPRRTDAGFSLIELSILLAVLALTLTASLGWLFPASTEEAYKAETTRERLDDIKNALHAFRVNYDRMPCPALPTLTDDDPLVGEEDCSVRASGVNMGILPVKSLGISPEYLVDGWGRRFTYQVSNNLCNYNTGGNSGSVVPLDCTSIRYNANTGDLTVRTTDVGNPGPDPAANGQDMGTNFAYVVISHGPDGFGAYMPSGTRRTVAGEPVKEAINTDNNTTFWTDPYNSEFDDLLIYETKDQIEAATTDYDRVAFTLQQCQNDVSNTIGFIDYTEYQAIQNGLLDPANSIFGESQTPGPAILSIFWHAELLCSKYYPYYYTSDQLITCPGATHDDASDANDIARVYDSTGGQKECKCPAGYTWQAACGKCRNVAGCP